MNKQEAAEYLGVSVRAIERYVSAGKLPANYVRGKTGQVLNFDADVLERFKAELEAPVSRGTIEPDKARQSPTSGTTRATRPDSATSADSRTLARLDGANGQNALLLLSQAIAAATSDKVRQSPTVGVEHKLLLTLAEAQALTGLSRGVLRAAIDSGDLKAKQIGRAFRVKRADLEKYVGTI
jgi:excisionase family DNA binding protein